MKKTRSIIAETTEESLTAETEKNLNINLKLVANIVRDYIKIYE